ncbi:hypothetical protein LX32DRAFT_191173 [Colletotrichum zoysiae]|uniref:Uncharacterized protein n=1 Tax=Colletotrichum zoysiae TaxID=1216348 RepID=A0AAD9H5E8_9PEZI|nr:hypothetical protein LX32DRAFT_191173 [Colletotrichum zoysiae]
MLFPALQKARAACHRPSVLRRDSDLNGLVMTPLGDISRRGRGGHCHTGKPTELNSQKYLPSHRKLCASRSSVRARLELAWELRQRLGQAGGRLEDRGLVAWCDVPARLGRGPCNPSRRQMQGSKATAGFRWHVDSIATGLAAHRRLGAAKQEGSKNLGGKDVSVFAACFPGGRAAGGCCDVRMTPRVALGGIMPAWKGERESWMAGRVSHSTGEMGLQMFCLVAVRIRVRGGAW